MLTSTCDPRITAPTESIDTPRTGEAEEVKKVRRGTAQPFHYKDKGGAAVHLFGCALNLDSKVTGMLAVLLGLEETLKTGLSPHSPFAFATYGVLEVMLGRIQNRISIREACFIIAESST